MPIEFRCTQCNRLLRTPDETAGKQAQCPECGAITTIPPASTAAPVGAAPPPSAPGGSDDVGLRGSQPDQPADSGIPGAQFGPQWPAAAPAALDMGDVLNRTWNIIKRQWGSCLGAALIVFVLNWLITLALEGGGHLGGRAAFGRQGAVAFHVFGGLVGALIGIWLQIGLMRYFLKVARDGRANLSDLFSGGPYYVDVLVASILYLLITAVGFLLCVVPGIIFSLMFSQYYLLILDRNLVATHSLSESMRLMRGNKLTLFLIDVIVWVGGMAVIVLTCGLGLLAFIPFTLLVRPVVYLILTGQATSDQLSGGMPR